jgi:hypothetical protein
MMKMSVSVTKDQTKNLKAAMRLLSRTEVAVGYPEGETKEREDVVNDVDGRSVTTPAGELSNAQIAYIQDRGSPANNIPPRPFLDDGVASMEAPIEKQLARAASAAVEGNLAEVEKGFQGAGIEAVTGVRNKLVQGPFEALKERTLAMRKARGFKGTKPLNQTGQLRMAANYAVRRRT